MQAGDRGVQRKIVATGSTVLEFMNPTLKIASVDGLGQIVLVEFFLRFEAGKDLVKKLLEGSHDGSPS
jgi:hypothetical protein